MTVSIKTADLSLASPSAPVRIMLVDDHPILLQGLAEVLEDEADLVIVGLIVGGAEAVTAAAQLQPDVIVIDIQMPEIDGVEAIRRIMAQPCPSRILILSSSGKEIDVRRAFAAGACGYLLKNTTTERLIAAIHQVMAGEPAIDPAVQRILMQQFQHTPAQLSARDNDLTVRETAVLQLIARGRSNKEIGIHLGLAENTVKHHVSSILQKLDLADRTQLAIYAHQHQLV